MFLTYERNVVKLAEYLTTQKGGLDLAYVTSMDIDADPHLLDGASALVSMGHDEYWTPAGARQRHRGPRQGRQPGVLRCERAVPAHPPAADHPGRGPRGRLLQDGLHAGPRVQEGSGRGHQRLARRPELRPGVHPDRHALRGLPGRRPARGLVTAQLGLQGHRRPRGRELPAPGRRRVRPRQPRLPGAAPHRGPVPLPADLQRRRQLRRLGVLHPLGRRRRLQLRHDALGRGALRRPAARHRRRTPAFARQVTANVLRAFSQGPAADKYKASDNLDAIHERDGSPIAPGNLQ